MRLEWVDDQKSTLPRTPFKISVGVRYISAKYYMVKESGIPQRDDWFLNHCEESRPRTTTGTIKNKGSEGVSKPSLINLLEASDVIRWSYFSSTTGSDTRPTPGDTNHCMQQSRLSTVWAPSRYHVTSLRMGSRTVWHRPGHLVVVRPRLKDSGSSDSSNNDPVCDCRKVLAKRTASAAFCTWCTPASPVQGEIFNYFKTV